MTPAQQRAIVDMVGLEHLLLTARGTTALWASLRALVSPESHVLVPANVCEVVVAAILEAGMLPRYVDVDPIGGNCSTKKLETARSEGCKALIAVHNYGTPLPMDEIVPWARTRKLIVIEDCCNALGATWRGKPVGTFGDVAVYSFGHAKIIDLGYGGLIASTDPHILSQCRRAMAELPTWDESRRKRDEAFQACLRTMRQYSELRDPALYRTLYARYAPALIAGAPEDLAGRLADAAGALPANLTLRRQRATYYRRHLKHDLIRHRNPVDGDVYWRYTFHVPADARDQVVRRLRERGLPIRTWFPAVDRLFTDRHARRQLPGADQFERTVLNLFLSPDTDDATVTGSSEAVLKVLEETDHQGGIG